MTKVAITGHRADQLGQYIPQYIKAQVCHAYTDLGASLVIQGMADGADLLSAKWAYDMHIPYIAVRPWAGHNSPPVWREWYQNARVYAQKVIVLDPSETYPGPWVYHNRNKWMVDHCDVLLAIWDGSEAGGTYATIKYAIGKKPIWHINPKTRESGWLSDK